MCNNRDKIVLYVRYLIATFRKQLHRNKAIKVMNTTLCKRVEQENPNAIRFLPKKCFIYSIIYFSTYYIYSSLKSIAQLYIIYFIQSMKF